MSNQVDLSIVLYFLNLDQLDPFVEHLLALVALRLLLVDHIVLLVQVVVVLVCILVYFLK